METEMAYLCCSSCCVRLPRPASGAVNCPECDGPLETRTAAEAFGYRVLDIGDPLPLAPTAVAVAVALNVDARLS
jgi:hypothetical protein